ncbi:helix-turn-helix domain-containing protein [Streptomyces sioyaensis]|uniref:XRE family transcriptional regulator n=1 Tax=Streptomyces sioyaensis TaxID=67364 RepID=A0A4Q1QXL7_9ACTN|nr:helix-turn-helix transcriptional regulator [Streptomyces sioyaensis]MBM4791156.1 helix-turn-helix domain-containing protein [Streptomyces sioyaensis]RXS63329.1 XRE family transcriptional regulator [Streptomyces sioyaensis]
MASNAATQDAARRRQELRDFLMTRRARVTPAEAGLPDGGRRRTPGLRREEVAVLAGVGASWYQWLEQGRDITVSPQVLDAVARVLRLNGAERRHLYVLAGLNPPPRQDAEELGGTDVCAGLQRLIDAWMPFPAHIMDPYWNTIAYNESAHLVLGHGRPGVSRNCLIAFFTDPVYRARAASWETNAPQVVAQFRAACSVRPGDEGFDAVVRETSALSAEFAELWARADVQDGGTLHKELDHPLVGALLFETTLLRIPVRPDLSIVLHNPRAESDTAAKLEWLTSPEGRRGGMSSVAG